jgi:septal ring factor EnvC (AmiA/AmiB activator)
MTLIADPRFDSCGLAVVALALAFTLSANTASAQADRQSGPAALDALKRRDQELEAVRLQQKKSAETEKKLRAEIDALGEDRRKLTQSLIDTGSRIRAGEDRIAAVEARVAELNGVERGIRRSLDGRRAVIGDVLAALQRVGRRPPPAVMMRPEDALDSVRTAMMLGAVLPEMQSAAEALAADLADLLRVRREIDAEHERLAADIAKLSEDRSRMTLLVQERQRRQAEIEKSLEGERARAGQLAQQADSLKELVARLEQNLDSAARAARAAARAAEDGKTEHPNLAALKDPGRLSPAVAFASAKGLLPLPVNGVKTRDFGSPDPLGGAEKGMSITTRAGAQVTAPCDGWVVYAAPYRSYGQLLILNAGGGYHIVLAGMERMTVDLGQFVLTGEPVGVMGSGTQVASGGATGPVQPVLYIEFRKDGTPVDPTPWWATNDSEKVRG